MDNPMRKPRRRREDILKAIERSRLKRPPRDPWNDVEAPMKLYASPEIKARLGLKCKTTVEYLENCRHESQ